MCKARPAFPPSRLTWQALTLIAGGISAPIAVALWTIEALL